MATRGKSTPVPADAAAPMTEPRRIEYMRPEDLVPADENPKLHDQESLGDSVDRLGFIESMILDGRTGKLVAGHGRRDYLIAAEAAGEDLPEGVIVDDDGHWRAPVTCGWESVDDDEAEAAVVALNGVAAAGGTDSDVLDRMLTRLASTPSGLSGTGYGTKKTEGLLKRLSAPKPLKPSTKSLRKMKWKWYLVRVPLHRVAEVSPLIDQISAVPDVVATASENAGGRVAALEGRDLAG
ncbi:MAG TPA: hypothetical protein VMX12_00045 [Acidimicrobiia bacterium]|nr:hypothetical protein [Acidimicrobiia bacterium]